MDAGGGLQFDAGGARNGCCWEDQNWMLKPEVDAPQEQGLNEMINNED